MTHFIDLIWNYKFFLAPSIALYLVFDLPTIFRRFTRKAYGAIYFIFFPLGHSDELYSQYFGFNDFYQMSELNENELSLVRTKILITSFISIIFSVGVSPFAAGLISGYFYTDAQFFDALLFIVLVKILLIFVSLRYVFTVSFINDTKSKCFVVSIYAIYIIFVIRIIIMSREFISQYIKLHGTLGSVYAIIDFFILNILWMVIVAAIAGSLTSYYLTTSNRRIAVREEQGMQ